MASYRTSVTLHRTTIQTFAIAILHCLQWTELNNDGNDDDKKKWFFFGVNYLINKQWHRPRRQITRKSKVSANNKSHTHRQTDTDTSTLVHSFTRSAHTTTANEFVRTRKNTKGQTPFLANCEIHLPHTSIAGAKDNERRVTPRWAIDILVHNSNWTRKTENKLKNRIQIEMVATTKWFDLFRVAFRNWNAIKSHLGKQCTKWPFFGRLMAFRVANRSNGEQRC